MCSRGWALTCATNSFRVLADDLEPVVGREVFYERMVNLAAPNKKVTLHVHRLGVIDGAVVSERTDEVVIDGISRSVPVVGITEFDGPLISHWREYYDLAQLRRAQGKGE